MPSSFIEPGQWVRHPGQPEWGVGQVQSVTGARVTANFEHAGKVTLNTMVVTLDVLDEPPETHWTEPSDTAGQVSGARG